MDVVSEKCFEFASGVRELLREHQTLANLLLHFLRPLAINISVCELLRLYVL